MTEPTKPDQAGAPRRVLLVDDEPSILRSLKRTLRRGGYEVLTAEGGAAGIELLNTETIQVIICDQRMPDVAGPEVLAAAYELQPDAFRITLTGYTDLEAAQKSINEGHVNQFLMKPWDDEHLRRCVADGLRSHDLVVENRRLQKLTQQQNDQLTEWNTKLEEKVEQRTAQVRRQNELLGRVNRVMQDSLRDTVELLASVMEMSDPALGLHSKRVALIAQRLGQWVGLDEDGLRDLGFATRLHEIGVIGGAPTKPGESVSRAKQREAAENGYHVLSRVAGFSRIARAVRDQAEAYDASVPNAEGKKESVSTVARLLAVADVYDSATFDRADPTKIDRGAGRRAIESGRGNRLDPELCDALLKNLVETAETPAQREVVELRPRQVRVGMTLADDLMSAEGVLLIKAGTRIGESLIHRVRQLTTSELLADAVRVFADPRAVAA